MSEKVPKVVLCDRRYTFARFSEDDLHFSSRCSTLDVSCCVFFFANCIVRDAQIAWQAWDIVRASFCAAGAKIGTVL